MSSRGVVRAGAEDEHREDADGRLVPGDVDGREGVRRDRRGELVCHADDGERDEPEHGTAVGDDEQEGHDRGGRREQPQVRPVEDGGQVGLDGRGPGDLRGDPVRQVGAHLGAQVGDDLSGLRRVRRVDGHDDERRAAVVGHRGRSPRRPGQLAREARDGPELLRGQRRVAAEQHDRRRPVGLGDLLEQLGRREAVGADGHRGGGRRATLGLADDADDGAGAEQGGEGEQPRDPASSDEVGEPLHGRPSLGWFGK